MNDGRHDGTNPSDLLDWFADKRSCAVAFSAGVDSAVVAQAAYLALGARAVAITGVSPSLAEGELEQARGIARQIGIRHEVIQTLEFSQPQYVRNSADRCFHCKDHLYAMIEERMPALEADCLVNGANLDDLQDYRPGLRAASEHRVFSPLAECGLSKSAVRALAKHWRLPIWDKPATPCLSSRVAYGEQVTPERLQMIDRAEQFLRECGLTTCRVRYHGGDLARVEIPAEQLPRLADDGFREALAQRLRTLGFRYVTLDLEGFRSGSLNSLVQIDVARFRP